jgi:uncharacterized protein (DUF305 family)
VTSMWRELIPRTVLLLSIATAIVAVSIALELPQRGGGEEPHGAMAPHGSAPHDTTMPAITSEAAFITGMVAHHQEAVDVALEVLERGERDEVRRLAAAIAVEQAAEIDRLRSWWAAWYPDQPPAPYVPMMRRLEGLTPAEVDLVFVADTIHHHEMAIVMAEDLLALGEARPEVEALARDVVRSQGEEIATLRGWLDAWSAAPPTPHAPGH